jgi:hypothetical protein
VQRALDRPGADECAGGRHEMARRTPIDERSAAETDRAASLSTGRLSSQSHSAGSAPPPPMPSRDQGHPFYTLDQRQCCRCDFSSTAYAAAPGHVRSPALEPCSSTLPLEYEFAHQSLDGKRLNTLRYVFENYRKHARETLPWSWRDPFASSLAQPLREPSVWLLRVGWTRAKPYSRLSAIDAFLRDEPGRHRC